ncbi:class I SAM-dependent methyltransferase [uncultured Selenomonas sp.]|uniref:class I SAM-dependent methyltransferase n=1 Tax=uncultured Selenomonas sp. TaxID=159275 RepID=UPI0028E30CD9|nr:class I SAM-dependent methyltransferase [uncultured Selenomonas sp.]
MMDEELRRYEKIRGAYGSVGRLASLYDGMMTYSTWSGKLVSRLVWGLDRSGVRRYVTLALRAAHEGFAGRLLEVPVGTGCLSLPVYAELPAADITCLDYAPAMLAAARARAAALDIRNVTFTEGDVGHLTFDDAAFDAAVSINGFHAFPDKEAAWSEVHRVLRPGGRLTGSVFVLGENARTDFVVTQLYTRMGFFTPPYDTRESLTERLRALYAEVSMECVESLACFSCVK